MDRQTIDARIALFVSTLQALYDAHYAAEFPTLMSPAVTADAGGSKYRRIITTQRYHTGTGFGLDGQRSAYCFIDLSNGDILKAAGWKAPAKGARGNIFNDNCDVGTRANVYGGGLYR